MPEGGFEQRRKLARALEIFLGWIQGGREAAGFEDLCAAHQDLSGELRQLHAVLRAANAGTAVTGEAAAGDQEGSGADEETLPWDAGAAASAEAVAQLKAGLNAEPAAPAAEVRYEVERELARGGMGVIYRVRDLDLSRTLAMKVMRGRAGDARGAGESTGRERARFLEEAQLTAQLDHPGIVPVHELGFDADQHPFFTMKLVEGRDLSEVFADARAGRGGWNLSRAVGVLVKACQATAYAHSKGVVHRDLKPSNIMVGRFGEVYVMDWGLAKASGKRDLHDIRLRSDQHGPRAGAAPLRLPGADRAGAGDSPLVTMDGSVVGTPAFMSPEQARGEISQVDALSDIYSLGAILYTLLAGVSPYAESRTRPTPHVILERVIQGAPAELPRLNPKAPPELIAICAKAMRREKSERYQSGLELAEDLQAYLDHRIVRAYRTGAVAELRSWVERNRMTALVGGCALGLALASLSVAAWLERKRSLALQEALAREHLQRGQALCEAGDLTRGLHWMAKAWKRLPGTSAALREVIGANLDGWSRRFAAPVAVLRHDTLVTAVVWSPDGRRLATTAQDGTVHFWSATDGAPEPISVRHPEHVMVIGFSPDGERVLTGSRDQTARLSAARSGAVVAQTMVHQDHVTAGAFSADGRWIITGCADGTVRIWSAETGAPASPPLAQGGRVTRVRFSPDAERFAVVCGDSLVRLWRRGAGGWEKLELPHARPVREVWFTPDGKQLLSQATREVVFWSAETGLREGKALEHETTIYGMALVPSLELVLVMESGGVLRAWSTRTRERVEDAVYRRFDAAFAALDPRGRYALTVGSDRRAYLWSLATQEQIGSPMLLADDVESVAFSPDGTRFAIQPRGHAAILWAIQQERSDDRLFQDSEDCTSLAVGPDGKVVAAGTWQRRQAVLWSAETGQQVGAPMVHGGRVWSVDFSPDGRSLLTGSGDGTARLWSTITGEPQGFRVRHELSVRAARFSADGKRIATGSFDKTARVWSVETGEPIGPLLTHPNFVEDVVLRSDGKALLTACSDGAGRLWEVETGSQLLPELRHRDAVLAVAFSPDERWIATGGRDHLVRFWNAADGRPVGPALDHPYWVEDIQFSPDGKRLWTLSRAVRQWDMETGEPVGPPLPNSAGALDLALSLSGEALLIAGNPAGRARLVKVPRWKGEIRDVDLWLQALTWTQMDENGALIWLEPAMLKERRESWAALQSAGAAPR